MLEGRNRKHYDHVLTLSTILCHLWSETRQTGYSIGVTVRVESGLDLVKEMERAKERNWSNHATRAS